MVNDPEISKNIEEEVNKDSNFSPLLEDQPKRNELIIFLFDTLVFGENEKVLGVWEIISGSNVDYYKISYLDENDKAKIKFFIQKEFSSANKFWNDLRIKFFGGEKNGFPY